MNDPRLPGGVKNANILRINVQDLVFTIPSDVGNQFCQFRASFCVSLIASQFEYLWIEQQYGENQKKKILNFAEVIYVIAFY